MAELAYPPDPKTKTPKLKTPPGAVDCHFHLFGPISKYPFDPDSIYLSGEALPETIMAMHKILGISRGVIVSGGGYGTNPAYLLDTLARYPDYFRGVAVPPEQVAPDELARWWKLGVRAVRFITPGRNRRLPSINPVLSAQGHELGMHVEFYPHGDDIIEYADKLLALPNRIVIDHFGALPPEKGVDQPAFKAILKLLDTGRVYVKISGPMRASRMDPPDYPDMRQFAQALVTHAPERLVWGTDWPHVNMNDKKMPNDGDLLDLLLDWVPDEATRKLILVDNPCRLYGFPKP